MREETGIDIHGAEIIPIGTSAGEHQKTLRDTGEVVLVKMTFYDYRINLELDASAVIVKIEDD